MASTGQYIVGTADQAGKVKHKDYREWVDSTTGTVVQAPGTTSANKANGTIITVSSALLEESTTRHIDAIDIEWAPYRINYQDTTKGYLRKTSDLATYISNAYTYAGVLGNTIDSRLNNDNSFTVADKTYTGTPGVIAANSAVVTYTYQTADGKLWVNYKARPVLSLGTGTYSNGGDSELIDNSHRFIDGMSLAVNDHQITLSYHYSNAKATETHLSLGTGTYTAGSDSELVDSSHKFIDGMALSVNDHQITLTYHYANAKATETHLSLGTGTYTNGGDSNLIDSSHKFIDGMALAVNDHQITLTYHYANAKAIETHLSLGTGTYTAGADSELIDSSHRFIDGMALSVNDHQITLTYHYSNAKATETHLSLGAATTKNFITGLSVNNHQITATYGTFPNYSSTYAPYNANGYKVMQTAVSDPSASNYADTVITNVAQNANGNLTTLTKKNASVVKMQTADHTKFDSSNQLKIWTGTVAQLPASRTAGVLYIVSK